MSTFPVSQRDFCASDEATPNASLKDVGATLQLLRRLAL